MCAEQLTTTVTLTGDSFTPMPSQSLQKPEQLILPSVDLTMTEDLTGAAASGDALRVPDDPANPSGSRVKWANEQTMSFDVVPSFLTPGLYDVVVTNPDKKHQATFAGGLVAVPRPTITATDPDILCCGESDVTVTLTGKDILQVGSVLPTVQMGTQQFQATKVDGCNPLVGNNDARNVQQCTSATFVIPKGTFQPGKYPVTLTNPEPANCVSSDVVDITVVPPPTVAKIAADLVCDAQGDQTMTVTGTGFLQMGMTLPTVTLGTQTFTTTKIDGCVPVDGTFKEGAVNTCTSVTFTIPKGTFPEGDYDVVVNNPPPADCKSLETVKLHVAPPPQIAAIKPVEVCDAQNQQTVTINGNHFLEVGKQLPIVTIGMQMLTPTSAGGCVPVTGMFAEGVVQECTSLTVSVPKGTFTVGSYPVSVKNPDPAGCVSNDMVDLAIANPPVVTSTTPGTICQGGGQITANGTGFLPSASITLTSGTTTLSSASTTVNTSGTQVTGTFGGVGAPGTTYDVNVDNGDGCAADPPYQKVTVVTGPVAFFADPENVFNGINTTVTIYVTTLTMPATVTMYPAGSSTGAVNLTVIGTVPGHSNRLQVVVPKGTAAGSYDLHLVDGTGCPTILPNALKVVSATDVSIKSVIPPFGWTQTETSVTILRDQTAPAPNNVPFAATPRVFLNPSANQPAGNGCPALPTAIQLASVSYVDQNTLTAIVPKAQPTCLYDLVVVDPDGSVGFLPTAFTVQSAQPPTISAVTPSSIVDATNQNVVVSGQAFNASSISLSCVDSMGAAVAAPTVSSGTVSCGANGCTQGAVVNGSSLPIGSVCVVRLTNGDKSYFDYSAVGVTNSSLNLSATHAGQNMTVGRRALVASAGNATPSARFVYAIGGDGGAAMANTPFGSTEFASVDLFGNMGAWQPGASSLNTPRSFAASSTIGRYVYVAGGSDGTTALASVERAMILNPLEVPQLDVDDIIPSTTDGLDAGYWFYRVSATFSDADPDNPGGESLASDEFIVKVPTFTGYKLDVSLKWSPPVDSQGNPLPNVSGYDVYRTPMVNGASGGEVLIATVPAGTNTYKDGGTATPGAQKPLPLGSLGKFAKLPGMSIGRKGAAGTWGVDPSNPSTVYFYALLGLNPSGTALTSYEYLPITLQPNGHQTIGTWKVGASAASQGRWQIGAWAADSTVQKAIPAGTTYVYVGGGLNAASTAANNVDVGKIAAGGDLGTLALATKTFSSNYAGYGVCAANDQLFAFGGQNATPSTGAISAKIGDGVSPNPAPPGLDSGAWNNEGISLVNGRYLMGSSVQSAFIFLVGGQTPSSAASQTTELVIW